ncbi:MAG: hypothetical protein COW03_03035 [Cytophagales bacterium CG12_big_fil_rev_8_21_14_0_65_40_12]|nr:MAG: hypothetical protein COW03_03035 [Cytophagales bacterium CG12_big_fil_rev_8_21_14_0_65_40_12]PIW06006.1 MAG: hypothetical protein COW40_01850 [Cytophagales bacterium CG17_big_fil_post_rev_8_21_14_2_50_40_13]
MAENLTRSQKFGIQWRWLFLIGGVIYAINIIKALANPAESYTFLGLALGIIPYLFIQVIIAAWLLTTFVKNHKLFRQITLQQMIEQQEKAQEDDSET